MLPLLAVLLIGVLGAALFLVWQAKGREVPPAAGQLAALGQKARLDAQLALAGAPEGWDRVASDRTELTALLPQLQGTPAGSLIADGNRLSAALAGLLEQGDAIAGFAARRDQLADSIPNVLAATANLAAAMTPPELSANQRYLERFELYLQGARRDLDLLLSEDFEPTLLRLENAAEFFAEILRGLAGDGSTLEMLPVSQATDELAALEASAGDLLAGLRNLSEGRSAFTEGLAAAGAVGTSADALLSKLRATAQAPAGPLAGQLPLVLVGAGLLLALLLGLAYLRADDLRRAADVHSEQNERNQQAILLLLDELSNLADGDLTVQATVTEDITGAIADSINFAIEALRDLVVTIKDSAILVDAATKQTEGTAQHLVRSSETQAKQVAAASESIAQMAISIEEVSGNSERCSDVARHSVEVAHKGGQAVRRSIEGMNTIRETIQETSKRIKRLGESSQEIGNIVELINDIAEQTNILALNASIQASMAGEAGRGFAVVADEVQRLAERSGNATKQIEVLVSTIQSDTNEAVVSMERSTTDVVGGALLTENAGAALEEIEQVSNQIASLVQNISGSARKQSEAAGGITRNMQVLREISAKTTQSTTNTSAAISKLSELASQLRRTVAGFTLPDPGAGATMPATPAPDLAEAAAAQTTDAEETANVELEASGPKAQSG